MAPASASTRCSRLRTTLHLRPRRCTPHPGDPLPTPPRYNAANPGGPHMTQPHPLPTEQEALGYIDSCSNWGRWGPDDDAGTVNLITPQKRIEAASLVKNGRAVSLAYPLNTAGGPGNANPAQHFVRTTATAAVDYIGILFHG